MHPGVVRLLSYTVTSFDLQLAFPFHGEDFNETIRSWAMRKDGAVDLLPSICKQLANTLVFVHSLHIVHRDIKPGNVLVDRRPLAAGGTTAVLADLGRRAG